MGGLGCTFSRTAFEILTKTEKKGTEFHLDNVFLTSLLPIMLKEEGKEISIRGHCNFTTELTMHQNTEDALRKHAGRSWF